MVYISSGQKLYRGRGDKWECFHTNKELIYGYNEIVWHDNRLWCTDDLRFHVFKDGEPSYTETNGAIPGHFSSRDGVLLTGGLGEKISWVDQSGKWTPLFS